MNEYPTAELRFVRREVKFDGHAEPAFRLILQQKFEIVVVGNNGDLSTKEEWRDIPTFNEPKPE